MVLTISVYLPYKGIKTLVSMKQKNNDTHSIITKDEKDINDPLSIANTFNNFFTTVAETFTQKSNFEINHSKLFCRQKSMILS